MTRIYSHYHSIANFIGKCIPKSGAGSYGELFVHKVIEGLKRLDAAQRANPVLTVPYDVDGINVFHRGSVVCRIMPAQKNLLLIFANEKAKTAFDKAADKGLFEDSSHSAAYRSWKVPSEGLDVLWTYIENLPKPRKEELKDVYRHPRTFSVAARLQAYDAFEKSGFTCPGFGARKRHKVEIPAERIEYDHILPFAKGGSSSAANVRIICYECNRLKGARLG